MPQHHEKMWDHHLKLASTYHMLAHKYEHMNPNLHIHYYLKHLQHANEMEKHFLMTSHSHNPHQSHHSHHFSHHDYHHDYHHGYPYQHGFYPYQHGGTHRSEDGSEENNN